MKTPPAFSKIDCAVYYGGAAARVLTKFKYGASPSMAGFLAGFMLDGVRKKDETRSQTLKSDGSDLTISLGVIFFRETH